MVNLDATTGGSGSFPDPLSAEDLLKLRDSLTSIGVSEVQVIPNEHICPRPSSVVLHCHPDVYGLMSAWGRCGSDYPVRVVEVPGSKADKRWMVVEYDSEVGTVICPPTSESAAHRVAEAIRRAPVEWRGRLARYGPES